MDLRARNGRRFFEDGKCLSQGQRQWAQLNAAVSCWPVVNRTWRLQSVSKHPWDCIEEQSWHPYCNEGIGRGWCGCHRASHRVTDHTAGARWGSSCICGSGVWEGQYMCPRQKMHLWSYRKLRWWGHALGDLNGAVLTWHLPGGVWYPGHWPKNTVRDCSHHWGQRKGG